MSAGGFVFKQWKEKYLVLTMEGSLLVCRDAESPPDQVVALQTLCESIAEGREILDLPRLPPGGRRDCCFALILPQNKFLLLLTENPDDCKLVSLLLMQTHTHTHTNIKELIIHTGHRAKIPSARNDLSFFGLNSSYLPVHHNEPSAAALLRSCCKASLSCTEYLSGSGNS